MIIVVILKLPLLIVLPLIFLLILIPVNEVYALSQLYEDFSEPTLDSSIWSVEGNGGNVLVSDGVLELSAPNGKSFPYIFLNNASDYFNGDFTIEFRIKFTGPLNFGYGLSLTDNLKSNGSTIDPQWLDRIFLTWANPNGTFSLYSSPCPDMLATCSNDQFYSSVFTANWNNWHKIRISREENVYSAYLDDVLKFVSKPSSRIVSELWIGNYQRTGGVVWGNLFVDEIQINPTQTVSAMSPIIVVPGLGASWDFEAILSGGSGSSWKIPPFVTLYDNLIGSLVNVGYEENKNLFVFAYDWRKPLSALATDLENYIDKLVSSEKIGVNDKFIFIGHSYGGLVARYYAQQEGSNKIQKVVTAGSPHEGVVDSFGVWEGAEIWKEVWWQRAALEISMKLNQRIGEKRVETLRRIAPSIKDTLPTFEFLKRDGMVSPNSSLSQQNTTLESANNITEVDGQFAVFGGKGFDTLRYINVIDRDWRDRALGLWEDGKPAGSAFESSYDGDGAVLGTSSLHTFSNSQVLNLDHGDVISSRESLEAIFDQLALDKSKVALSVPTDKRQSVFVASLRSPGRLHVCNSQDVCDGELGIYLSNEKLFFLPGYDSEKLEVVVDASGEIGKYQLHLGRLTVGLSSWVTRSGDLISSAQVDEYFAEPAGEQLIVEADDAVTSRGFDRDILDLNRLSAGWDKKNLLNIARSNSQPTPKRVVAIRQLREVLSSLAIKAKINNRLDRVEAIIGVWLDIDELAEKVIGGSNSTKVAFLNSNIKAVDAYKILADSLLKNSSSYYAATFYELFEKKFTESKSIRNSRRDLSLDKTLSARYLLLTAIGLR